MTTQVIGVGIYIQSDIANTRTYALACAESINVSEYANQVIVQQFFQRYKDDPNYRLAVVELKDKFTGQSHQGGSKQMVGSLLQVFNSFGSGNRTSDFSTLSYSVYVITYQSPNARNPTIKVVSEFN